MKGELFIKLKSFFFRFWTFFCIFGKFFKTQCCTFLRMIKIFHFLLSTVFKPYQVYYTILFIAIEFIFTVSLKYVFCLPKKPQLLFFSWLDYKSLLNKLSVLTNYSVLGGLPIIFLQLAVFHVFQGPGPGSGSRF